MPSLLSVRGKAIDFGNHWGWEMLLTLEPTGNSFGLNSEVQFPTKDAAMEDMKAQVLVVNQMVQDAFGETILVDAKNKKVITQEKI